MCSNCMQVGGAGLAVMDDPKRGIQFGAEGTPSFSLLSMITLRNRI